jgi:beta-lactamase regulating signal transducer with metallopeptidase domain
MTDTLAFYLSRYSTDGLALLLEWSLKALLLALTAAGLALLLRRSTAAARHWVWSLAMVGLLAIPPLSLLLPAWSTPVARLLPSWEPTPRALSPAASASSGEVVRAEIPVAKLQSPTRSNPAATARSSWAGGLFALWIAGALAGISSWLTSLFRLRLLARSASPVTDPGWRTLLASVAQELHLKRGVSLLTSGGNTMPATFGTWRPVVLLPGDAASWTEERKRLVLLHELSHVKRRDCLTQLLARLGCAVYWFHPAAWYAASRMRDERELACDQEVLGAGDVDACDYAEHLVEIARRLQSLGVGASAAVALARPSQLERRLRAILDGEAQSGRTLHSLRLGLCLSFALLTVPLAAMRPWADPSGQSAPSSAGVTLSTAGSERVFHWQGRIPAGKRIEVHTVRGHIHAELASGDQAEIVVFQRGRRAGQEPIKVELKEDGEGVLACPQYGTGVEGCWPAKEEEEAAKKLQIDFVVRVPAGVRWTGNTYEGDIEAMGLHSVVAAGAIDGHIQISTTEHAHASNVNGDIDVAFGSSSWSGDLEFQSVKGNIDLVLPADLSAAVEAQAGKGKVSASFPLAKAGSSWAVSRGLGQVGEARRTLTVKTVEGNVSLRRPGDKTMYEVPRNYEE